MNNKEIKTVSLYKTIYVVQRLYDNGWQDIYRHDEGKRVVFYKNRAKEISPEDKHRFVKRTIRDEIFEN